MQSVAPKHGTTIPRLELCAAVFAVEVAESIQRNQESRSSTRPFTVLQLAKRPILADNLKDSLWHSRPQEFLDEADLLTNNSYPLVSPVEDKELRPAQDPCILKTSISTDPTGLGSHRFQRFFNWRTLIRAIAFLILHEKTEMGK